MPGGGGQRNGPEEAVPRSSAWTVDMTWDQEGDGWTLASQPGWGRTVWGGPAMGVEGGAWRRSLVQAMKAGPACPWSTDELAASRQAGGPLSSHPDGEATLSLSRWVGDLSTQSPQHTGCSFALRQR